MSTRDFVNLRHWSMIEGGVFVSAGASVTHPAMPPQNKKVRLVYKSVGINICFLYNKSKSIQIFIPTLIVIYSGDR